jgi:hypothetical protein
MGEKIIQIYVPKGCCRARKAATFSMTSDFEFNQIKIRNLLNKYVAWFIITKTRILGYKI